jgi:hypothetical protein
MEETFEELGALMAATHVKKHRQRNLDRGDKIINSMKSEHDTAPGMVDNCVDLKLRILSRSGPFGIIGDIELDQGYSFAYQITIFFPTYF